MLPARLPHTRSLAVFASLCLFVQCAFAQLAEPVAPPPVQVEADDEGIETLTRGALHEAFADQVSQDLKTGVLAPLAPPEAIEELPPEIKPEGDDILWIPGYWYWEDERDDYIWISGVWRKAPPGRRWVPGYWTEVDGKYRRVAGMWSSGIVSNLEYLPYPPDSLESGPASPSPSDDYFWAPGCWVYHNAGYSWRPGHWEPYRNNWVWMPTRYVWSPNGCLYLDGYWDYPFASRGQLYSPVYFHNHIYRQPHFRYRPCFTISTSSIFLHLFVRRGHSHYYFGNYYGNQHRHHYHPWYDYHHVGRRYDPLITHAHGRSHHAGIDYVKRMRDWNHYFTRHSDHRPPTTIKHQHAFEHRNRDFAQLKHVALGRSVKQTLHDRDAIFRSHRTSPAQHDQLRKRVAEVRTLAESRRRHETETLSRHQSGLTTTAKRWGGSSGQGREGTTNAIRHRSPLARARNGGADTETHNKDQDNATDDDLKRDSMQRDRVKRHGVTPEIATRGNAARGSTSGVGRAPDPVEKKNPTGNIAARDDATRGSITRNDAARDNAKRDLTKLRVGEQGSVKRSTRPVPGQPGAGRITGLGSQSGRVGSLSTGDRDDSSEDRVPQGVPRENRWGRGRINRVGSTQTPPGGDTHNSAAAAATSAAKASAHPTLRLAQPNSRTTNSNPVPRQQPTTPTPQPGVRRNVQPSPTAVSPAPRPTPPKIQSVRPAAQPPSEKLQAARSQFRSHFHPRVQATQPSRPSVVKPSYRRNTPLAPVGPKRAMNIPKPSAPTGRPAATSSSTSRQSASPSPSWNRPRPAARTQSRATFSQPRPSSPPLRPAVTQPKVSAAAPRSTFSRPQPKPSVRNRTPVGPQRKSFSNGFRGAGRRSDGDDN